MLLPIPTDVKSEFDLNRYIVHNAEYDRTKDIIVSESIIDGKQVRKLYKSFHMFAEDFKVNDRYGKKYIKQGSIHGSRIYVIRIT
jgi:hypothetical protein